MIMAVDDMNDADLQRTNTGNVIKINNRVDILNTHCACLHLFRLIYWGVKPTLFDGVCLCNKMSVDDMNGADSGVDKMQEMWKTNNLVYIINTHWACLLFVQAYQLMVSNLLFECFCIFAIMAFDDMSGVVQNINTLMGKYALSSKGNI